MLNYPNIQDLLSHQTDKQAIVFLKDVSFTDVRALVDYMYRGVVNVCQDRLATFLQTAEALKINGNHCSSLSGNYNHSNSHHQDWHTKFR